MMPLSVAVRDLAVDEARDDGEGDIGIGLAGKARDLGGGDLRPGLRADRGRHRWRGRRAPRRRSRGPALRRGSRRIASGCCPNEKLAQPSERGPCGARISGFRRPQLPEHPKAQQDRGDEREAEPGEGVAQMVVGELDDGLAALRQGARLAGRCIDGEGRRPGRRRSAIVARRAGIADPFDAVGLSGPGRERTRRLPAGGRCR